MAVTAIFFSFFFASVDFGRVKVKTRRRAAKGVDLNQPGGTPRKRTGVGAAGNAAPCRPIAMGRQKPRRDTRRADFQTIAWRVAQDQTRQRRWAVLIIDVR